MPTSTSWSARASSTRARGARRTLASWGVLAKCVRNSPRPRPQPARAGASFGALARWERRRDAACPDAQGDRLSDLLSGDEPRPLDGAALPLTGDALVLSRVP